MNYKYFNAPEMSIEPDFSHEPTRESLHPLNALRNMEIVTYPGEESVDLTDDRRSQEYPDDACAKDSLADLEFYIQGWLKLQGAVKLYTCDGLEFDPKDVLFDYLGHEIVLEKSDRKVSADAFDYVAVKGERLADFLCACSDLEEQFPDYFKISVGTQPMKLTEKGCASDMAFIATETERSFVLKRLDGLLGDLLIEKAFSK